MHALHEGDIGEHGFLVHGLRVFNELDRAHGALDGVQRGQAGEHAHRGLSFDVVSVCQLCTSLDSGTFSGSQKLAVNRSQTSRSLSSVMAFQLMADTGLPTSWCAGDFGA